MEAKEIVYEVLPPERWEEAVPVIKEALIPHEPINKYLGVTPELFNDLVPGGYKGLISDNITIVARNGEGGEIVGAKLLRIQKKGENADMWSAVTPVNKTALYYAEFCRATYNNYNIFEAFPEIDYAYEHILLCVRQEFGRRGIGTKLIEMADKIGIENSCKYAKGSVSAFHSCKAFRRNGYEVIHEVEYLQFEVDGVKPFDPKVVDAKTSDRSYLMIKKLQ